MNFIENQAWAPPFIFGNFGPWVKIYRQINKSYLTIDFSSFSDAPSTFDIELVVGSIAVGSRSQVIKLLGPTSYKVTTKNCTCSVHARFKSHVLGQNIQIKVSR